MDTMRTRIEKLEVKLKHPGSRLLVIDTLDTPDVEAEKERLLNEVKNKNMKITFLILEDEQGEELSADDFEMYRGIAKHHVDL